MKKKCKIKTYFQNKMKNTQLFFLPREGFLEKRIVFGAESFGDQEPTMPPASQRLTELRKQIPTQAPVEPTRPEEYKDAPTEAPVEPTRPEEYKDAPTEAPVEPTRPE